MPSCALWFVCLLQSASALAVGRSTWQPLRQAEDALARTCGAQCVALLHRSTVALQNRDANSMNVSVGAAMMDAVAQEVDKNLERANGLAAVQTPAMLTESGSAKASTNLPCTTQASCAMRSMEINKCNYARVAMQQTYNELNVATHVLGELVSSLCACVQAGHVVKCALRSSPAACAFPYTVYSKAFGASSQVWEAVKASTQACAIKGGVEATA